MMTADQVIRWTTAVAVIGVAVVAAVASYAHAYDLVRMHGEAGWTARLVPLTVDGLTYASSMVMLDSARRKTPVPALSRWLLGLGIAATLAANVAHGLGHGLVGATVAAWPAPALVGAYELFMMVIRSSQVPSDSTPETEHDADPLYEQAAELFAGQLAAGRVPPSPGGVTNPSGSAQHLDNPEEIRRQPAQAQRCGLVNRSFNPLRGSGDAYSPVVM